MAAADAPRIRRTPQNTQFTLVLKPNQSFNYCLLRYSPRYNLSRRVYDVKTYPILSPQGATILIYGHENGVTLVWRGGRRFKPSGDDQSTHQNGASSNNDDAVMVIDSDDDAAGPSSGTAFVDQPEFEETTEQGPYPEVVQTLDLSFGTPVLNVAVMPLDVAAKDAGSAKTTLHGETIVFAVSCITNDVYVITLPLTPPSPASKARPELKGDLLAGKAGSGAWGESLILLAGQSKRSEGLAISLVKPSGTGKNAKPPRAVVASHSKHASGVLQFWDVPLDAKSKPERPLEPFQTEFLPSPLKKISFNPTHTTQLLTVASPNAVRIYDYAVPSLPPDSEATGPFPTQGSWLLSLYQPFARPSHTRKPVLDAAWISHGRAIFTLLADGMWGVWDIDGASPISSGATISTKLKSGVKGASLTTFSISGYVEGTSSLRNIATSAKDSHAGEFAPMTPHTRKQATASLSSNATLDRLATVRGGISVATIPSAGKNVQDESLVLWVGGLDHVCIIPGMARFWDSQLRKGGGGGVNLFSGAQPTRMVKLTDLSTGLLGEPCCGVALIANLTGDRDSTNQEGGLPAEVVIRGETRVVIVKDGDDGHARKVGAVGLRRRLFSKEMPSAIIVHGEKDKSQRMSFNLSTAKAGSLRFKSFSQDAIDADNNSTTTTGSSRPRVGFDFASTLADAADASADLSRDVEAEMLGIMDIDQALEAMEDTRGSGRKKVFFEE